MQVDQIMNLSRTHLNDDGAINWPDAQLLPKLQEAHKELMMELQLAGIPVINEVSAVMTVAAGETDLSLSVDYPTDMITPIELKERLVGEPNQYFVPMTKVDFIPNIEQDTRLIWWCWRTEKILLLGALNAVEVELRYRRTLPTPTKLTDSVDFLFAELFLSRRIASLAYASAGSYERANAWAQDAQTQLSKIIRMNVNKDLQALPAKRQPYHRRQRGDLLIRGW